MTDRSRPTAPQRSRRSSETYTGPVEDYLKVIYELERATGAAATNDIARALDIAPPSASWMVRRLANQGLLVFERYHGARLTESGHRAALRILRRHRIIETFLVRVVRYGWDEVHGEAERLEHAASDELVDRMADVLGEPTVDPHGAPIPTRDGTVAEPPRTSLADLALGERARVVGASDEDAARLRYLAELGLVPGAAVVVSARAPFAGPITVRLAKSAGKVERPIGVELARDIVVKRLEKPSPAGRRRPRRSARKP
jgi:DtxR family transcriptional regulator, Mn-dependent transcriptional regulator